MPNYDSGRATSGSNSSSRRKLHRTYDTVDWSNISAESKQATAKQIGHSAVKPSFMNISSLRPGSYYKKNGIGIDRPQSAKIINGNYSSKNGNADYENDFFQDRRYGQDCDPGPIGSGAAGGSSRQANTHAQTNRSRLAPEPREKPAYASQASNLNNSSRTSINFDRIATKRNSKPTFKYPPAGKASNWFTKNVTGVTPSYEYPPPVAARHDEMNPPQPENEREPDDEEKLHTANHVLERERIQTLVKCEQWDGKGQADLYMFGKELGKGSFGVVNLAHHRITGNKVAIKVYDKTKFKKNTQVKRCRQEIALMEVLNSCYIVHLYEAFETQRKMYLVLEALSGGNLCTYVKNKKHLEEDEAIDVFIQIALALEYLHCIMGVVHRDIKLENILFTTSHRVKIADFGFSVFASEGDGGETRSLSGTRYLKSFCGTPSYMAPEIIRKKGYEGYPVDIWSLGVVFFAMLYGRFPFRAKNHEELYKLILTGSFSFPELSNSRVSQNSMALMRDMMALDIRARITAKGILQLGFLENIVHKAMASKRPPNQMQLQNNSIFSSTSCFSKSTLKTPISDDPQQDFDDGCIKQLTKFGFNHHKLKKEILVKGRNHITTTYYLLKLKQDKKRKKRERMVQV